MTGKIDRGEQPRQVACGTAVNLQPAAQRSTEISRPHAPSPAGNSPSNAHQVADVPGRVAVELPAVSVKHAPQLLATGLEAVRPLWRWRRRRCSCRSRRPLQSGATFFSSRKTLPLAWPARQAVVGPLTPVTSRLEVWSCCLRGSPHLYRLGWPQVTQGASGRARREASPGRKRKGRRPRALQRLHASWRV